jgi:hypothetical protein
VFGGRIEPPDALGGTAIGGSDAIGGSAGMAAATVGTGVGAGAGWQFSVRLVVRVMLPTLAVIVAFIGTRLVLVLGAVYIAVPVLLFS